MIANLQQGLPRARWTLIGALVMSLAGCKASSLDVQSAEAKEAISIAEIAAGSLEPGPIRLQKIVAANWQISLSGLLNLEDPKAKAAQLEDRSEAIQLYLYVIDHPQFGRFFIDSGMGDHFALPADGAISLSNRVFAAIASTAGFQIHATTGRWLKQNNLKPQAVFLTHMHFDHILGLQDIPASVPVYVGQGESEHRMLKNFGVQKITNALLGRDRPLLEIPFVKSDELAIVDWFGDKSFFVISSPGHTAGSLAFLIRSTEGWQLIVGDSSHTRWGWENAVRPGSFSDFAAENQQSLEQLIALSKKLPQVKVHLGHQSTSSNTNLEETPAK